MRTNPKPNKVLNVSGVTVGGPQAGLCPVSCREEALTMEQDGGSVLRGDDGVRGCGLRKLWP